MEQHFSNTPAVHTGSFGGVEARHCGDDVIRSLSGIQHQELIVFFSSEHGHIDTQKGSLFDLFVWECHGVSYEPSVGILSCICLRKKHLVDNRTTCFRVCQSLQLIKQDPNCR